MDQDVVIIIPARLNSQRLHQKPLQKIGNYTMIEHMINQVQKTGFKSIFVATDSQVIADVAQDAGAKSIMTDPSLSSGTDRVYASLQAIESINFNYVINVQGDMPFIEPEVITKVVTTLKSSRYEIITPVTQVDISIASSESKVKVVITKDNQALYFSRSVIPVYGSKFWYHIGIYGFKTSTLAKLVQLPPSRLELDEQLEQLRALENNIKIGVCYVDNAPISVDTKDDLQAAIAFYQQTYKLTNQ